MDLALIPGVTIRINESDNVVIVIKPEGLKKQEPWSGNKMALEHVPMGHKLACLNIEQGDPIIRYGVTIGFAKVSIKAGAWVSNSKISMPEPPSLKNLPQPGTELYTAEPLTGYNFEGYRNKNGSVGTRNVLGIATSVHCVAGLAGHLATLVKKELLQKYPNVDDVVPINHTYGCGVAIESPLAQIPVRTLRNIIDNPNFGNQVMILGLGCEKLRPEQLIGEVNSNQSQILYMQDTDNRGFSEILEAGLKMAEEHLSRLNHRKRETCPASKLVVGMQCGGSDGLSGITGNPVAGFASDLIVRAGGSVLFSEVTEVRDAAHVLAPRMTDKDVLDRFVGELKWYDDYLASGGADRSANTTPGNQKGGLSNVVEKALGSVVKSGTSPIVDVISPGEKVKKQGLSFVATPASDFICGTLQVAAGMNTHVFVTGRGTPYGLAMLPVVKVSTNSVLSKRWHDLIDIDAGEVALGLKTVEQKGWELFKYILDVASGKKQVACDRLKLHNDLVLFNPGPVT